MVGTRHASGRQQGVDDQVSRDRRRVDENNVIERPDPLERASKAARIAQSDLAIEVAVGREQIDARHGRRADQFHKINARFAQRDMDRAITAHRGDAEAKAGMALRIEIADQDPVSARGKLGCEIDCNTRLAGATLAIGDSQNLRLHRTVRTSPSGRLVTAPAELLCGELPANDSRHILIIELERALVKCDSRLRLHLVAKDFFAMCAKHTFCDACAAPVSSRRMLPRSCMSRAARTWKADQQSDQSS
jgi:hypothetical protein